MYERIYKGKTVSIGKIKAEVDWGKGLEYKIFSQCHDVKKKENEIISIENQIGVEYRRWKR